MLNIRNRIKQNVWFKGSTNNGAEAYPIKARHPGITQWPSALDGTRIMCLGMAVGWQNQTTMQIFRTIIQELFPERVWQGQPRITVPLNWEIVIGFNNHPDTVWEDIEKVISEYERRVV